MEHSSFQWSCPSCTFNNRPGAFKCLVCGTPKGTTTRQTKYHSSTVQKQHMVSLQLQRAAIVGRSQPGTSGSVEAGSSTTNGRMARNKAKNRKPKASARKDDILPRLKNIDRSSKKSCEITVDNLTVTITEYDMLYPDSN